ncbi:protoglobin domain-containing protein [Terrilactibacillus sp. S3-3]|nr:protoglobin domain-containing protein [Terrilactibacillus sp. S3-3]
MKEQIRLLDLTHDDLYSMACLKPMIKSNAPRIVDAFYGVIEQNQELLEIVEKNSSIEKLKRTLADFISEMFAGKIDEQFVEKRRKIAEIHLKIGLEPKWYLLAFGQLQDSLLEVLSENLLLPEDFTRAAKAVAKFINFEQQLVLEAYSEQEKSSRRQSEAIKKRCGSKSNRQPLHSWILSGRPMRLSRK